MSSAPRLAVNSNGAPRLARPTLHDVAARAGVSRSTASRVLTARGYAGAAARDRVISAADELGYVPDAAARNLKERVSTTVGLLVSDLRNPFYAEIAAGAAGVFRERGFTVLLVDDAGSGAAEGVAAGTFLAMRVAGVLLTPVTSASTAMLLRRGLPVVEVDRQFHRGKCDGVITDNVAAARDLTRHLLDMGHRRVVLLIDETAWTTGTGRLEGFRSAFAVAGRALHPTAVVHCAGEDAEVRARVSEVLTRSPRPTGIVAANNVIAAVVWRVARGLGLDIPTALSLVAFDDPPWMSMVDPGITTADQPATQLGAFAATALLARLEHPSRPRTTVLPYTFVVRGSTGPPRTA